MWGLILDYLVEYTTSSVFHHCYMYVVLGLPGAGIFPNSINKNYENTVALIYHYLYVFMIKFKRRLLFETKQKITCKFL